MLQICNIYYIYFDVVKQTNINMNKLTKTLLLNENIFIGILQVGCKVHSILILPTYAIVIFQGFDFCLYYILPFGSHVSITLLRFAIEITFLRLIFQF